MNFLTLLNLLNVIAFMFAIWQLLLARRQMNDARDQANRLNEIHDSLSTRYLGRFPDYLKKITEVIESAKSEIVIFCDYPAYGCFSDHENWHRYKSALVDKPDRGVQISLTCPDKAHRSQSSHEQFASAQGSWESWKAEEKNKAKLRFLFGSKRDLTRITPEEFLQSLEREDTLMLEELEDKIEVKQLEAFTPLHFWVADGRSAVFAIASYSDNVSNGFYTTDLKLIGAFYDIKARYHRDASEKVDAAATLRPVATIGSAAKPD
jgi:hypothetical protein